MYTEFNNQIPEMGARGPNVSPEPIRLFLLLGVAFFATWGPGLQKIAPVNLSKIFPVLAAVLVIYWALLGRERFRAFPVPFNLFFIFILIHSLVYYLIVFPGELTFGYRGVLYTQANYYLYAPTRGIHLVRFFLFVLLAYAVSSLLKNRKEFSWLALSYGAGFLISLYLGGHETIDAIRGYTRATGGFLNPNSLGIAALVCFYLNISVLLGTEAGHRRKILNGLFILTGLYGMLAAVSRNTLVAAAAGGTVIAFYLPLIKKIRWTIIIVCLLIAASALLPVSIYKTISSRVTPESIKESNWSMRRGIWSDYLRVAGDYFFLGTGLGRSPEAIRETYTFDSPRPMVPHQTYLQILVEFGILGLIMFLAAIWELLRRGFSRALPSAAGIENAVMVSLLIAFIVYGLTGGILGERTVWLALGCIGFVQFRLNESPGPKTGRQPAI